MTSLSRRARAAALREWRSFFTDRGWTPAPFQRELWRRYLDGQSGLLHTPTGSGKTLAAFGGPLIEALARRAGASTAESGRRGRTSARILRVLWVTPLRALASDTVRALREPCDALGLDWQIGLRSGDASARERRLARAGGLDALVITPESLALLLSYPDMPARLVNLESLVVDEWHELLGSKRGVLLQLALARLRTLAPTLRCWGLSATLGNLQQAREVLLPGQAHTALVAAPRPRPPRLRSLLPAVGERFPWSGHLGLSQLPRVIERLLAAPTSLLFTNTRAHAELWHRALQAVWPEDPTTLALHHGSLDPSLRAAAENGLREGRLRCVVCTSSLDLGVDFPSVAQVVQIGSPKGLARLLQRAGRARHRPGESGELICVASHALELAEYAAARRALNAGHIEARRPPRMALDVLAQHCVSCALAGGFEPAALLREVRSTYAFAELDERSWQSLLDFIMRGGSALEHYPDFRKVIVGDDGRYRVEDRRIALRHRLSIGTIVADGSVQVRLLRGGTLGSLDEAFVSRLRRGDHFRFAGRRLQLARLEDMTAYVRLARGSGDDGSVPQWQGTRLPLSGELGRELEAVLSGPGDEPELRALAPLLELQAKLSALPAPSHLLVEQVRLRGALHLFVYPFAGRLVHEGLAALLAARWGRHRPNSFLLTANDYGLMLSPQGDAEIDAALLQQWLAPTQLLEDLRESLNLGELARRQFRGIARVAGLLPPSLPGRAARSQRQLQASSGLIYDVLRRFDPDHLLLQQAEREVLQGPLELERLRQTLHECAQRQLLLHTPTTLTPLSFPLWAERLRAQLSTEDWQTRVRRAVARLEQRHRH